jgi:dolichol-phosphate mannosyltransferase
MTDPGAATTTEGPRPRLSVVVPVLNERDNVGLLVGEIREALTGRIPFEIVFVDDGSDDGTGAAIAAVGGSDLRVVRHARRQGQSAALHTGVRRARADWIATLDGDGQNVPDDIPRLLAARDAAGGGPILVVGHRRERRDSTWRRFQSRVANGVRAALLGDATPDTGCGLKLFPRSLFLELPFFDHMHRFLPALFVASDVPVRSVDVRHRPRVHGRTKYGLQARLWVGIVDLWGVRWLQSRLRRASSIEAEIESG